MDAETIKSMKLYSQVGRIYGDLKSVGVEDGAPLSVDLLSQFDQLHYYGADAVREAISAAGLAQGRRVLDVGAGLGGPARLIASLAAAHVDAVELQPDMNRTACDLTERCGLSALVTHVEGDIMRVALEDGAYDAVVSWLALYHIPDRAPLYPRLGAALRPGGRIYVEDLYQRAPFTDDEAEALATMLSSGTLPTRDAYVAEVESGGLTDIGFTDMTEGWRAFTAERLAAFRTARTARVAVYGAALYDELEAFYACIAGLFAGGRLGGVRLTAQRPEG